tara:strand:- start:4585 stop:6390 length:1806 start_codon:yes stop_codon:yes gene_type:complete
MAVPSQFLDELRSRITVSELIATKVKLIRRGREATGLCPFHNEKTPSFTVNDEKGFYHCFGCGAHGDIISFTMQIDGLIFPEAIEKLAGFAGLVVPRETKEDKEETKKVITLQQVMEKACNWFENQLRKPDGDKGLKYLRGRGFSETTISKFRLGFAPDARGKFRQEMLEMGVSLEQLVDCGLAKYNEHSTSHRDYFFNRVIFPISDRRGQVIAFGGRNLGEGQPKYLNSPETKLFSKGHILYNLAEARVSSRDTGTIIVVEGYTDVIALNQSGLQHCVAPLGTALTEEQIFALWKVVDEPLLCFDGDNAGRRAAFRAAQKVLPLLKPGKSLRFVSLPPGEDPDSLLKTRSCEEFEALLAKAQPLVDIIMELELGANSYSTPEQRASLERKLNNHIQHISDRSIQYHYQQRIRKQLRIFFSNADGARSGNKLGNKNNRFLNSNSLGPRGDLTAMRERQERVLISILINHNEMVHGFAEQLADISLGNAELDRVLREILNVAGDQPDLDSRALQDHLSQCGYQEVLLGILNAKIYRQAKFASPEASVEMVSTALVEIIASYRSNSLNSERRAAKKELAEEMTTENSERLLEIVREQSGPGRL